MKNSHRTALCLLAIASFSNGLPSTATATPYTSLSSPYAGVIRKVKVPLSEAVLENDSNHVAKTPSKKVAKNKVDDGKASVSSEIFSLAKTIVGAACFGLPAAMSTFGESRSAVISSLMVIASVGSLSAYGFFQIGRVCRLTGANSYQEAWARTVSPSTASIVSGASTLVCFGSLLAYTMVLSQTLRALLIPVGITLSKPQAILSLMTCVMLPLCRLKKLSLLAPFSLVGMAGLVYTVFVMALRYFTGAYAPGGQFFSSVANTVVFRRRPSVFVLISMLATAFSAHYNAPKFHKELRRNTMPRWMSVVSGGYLFAGVVVMAIASLGFLTFGANSSDVILNNYSAADGLMNMARFAVAISITASYPLSFSGLRDNVLDLSGIKNRSNKVLDGVTVGLLAVFTCLAMVVKDLRAVWAIGGATYGNALCFVLPHVMFAMAAKKRPNLHREIPIAISCAVVGLAMGAIGTKQALTTL